jgi:uncharacterized cupin superfamily protein
MFRLPLLMLVTSIAAATLLYSNVLLSAPVMAQGASTAAASGPVSPVKIAASEVSNFSAFKHAGVTTGTDQGAHYTNRTFGQSSNGKFVAGIYESAATHTFYASYPGDEFMFFITGKVTLTSAAGGSLEIGPQEGVFLPRGWRGTWDSTAYRKYYVYHDESAAK